MAYTTIDNPELYFQTKLYNGSNSGQSITFDGSENMQPDWVWIKSRNGSSRDHCLYDSVRGVNKRIESNNDNAENTTSDQLTSFDSNGFSVGVGEADINSGGRTFASWNWLAGGSASSNTDGSITSTVSANTTSGFSIVSYTGTGSNATIGHGLGVTPKWIIVKQRNTVRSWEVFHSSIPSMNTKYIELNTSAGATTYSPIWGGTDPTSTTFHVGTDNSTNNSSGNFIAYCFAEKQGYSKFGSYTGNGDNDGSFIYTGFKPAMVIYKKSSGTENWFIHDNKRQGFNPENEYLFPDLSNAEGTANRIDLLSNGFKATTSDGGINGSGASYIYMCFAEAPFVTAGTKAAGTAR